MRIIFIIALIVGLLMAGASQAKNKDQTLTIQLDAAGCIAAIVPPADDNCKENENAARAGCGTLKDCACGASSKYINWQAEPEKTYSIRFYDASPFHRSCRLQADDNGMLRCRITRSAQGNFDYAVTVEGCAEYDPRIVIRTN